MREIKFRGWIGGKCCYFDIDLISPYDGLGEYSQDAIIEQYTGLKDKNGIEIYEGDIVLHESLPGARNGNQIIFYNCRFSIKARMVSDWIDLCERSGQYIIVIGNIHENPALLEAT